MGCPTTPPAGGEYAAALIGTMPTVSVLGRWQATLGEPGIAGDVSTEQLPMDWRGMPHAPWGSLPSTSLTGVSLRVGVCVCVSDARPAQGCHPYHSISSRLTGFTSSRPLPSVYRAYGVDMGVMPGVYGESAMGLRLSLRGEYIDGKNTRYSTRGFSTLFLRRWSRNLSARACVCVYAPGRIPSPPPSVCLDACPLQVALLCVCVYVQTAVCACAIFATRTARVKSAVHERGRGEGRRPQLNVVLIIFTVLYLSSHERRPATSCNVRNTSMRCRFFYLQFVCCCCFCCFLLLPTCVFFWLFRSFIRCFFFV